jgi:hypothetical protein
MFRQLREDAGNQLVAVRACKQVRGVAQSWSTGNVRGLGRDEVEVLAGDRLEQAALANFDVVDVVENGIDLHQSECAWIDIRRDHALGMRAVPKSHCTRATADVQSRPHRAPSLEQRAERRGSVPGPVDRIPAVRQVVRDDQKTPEDSQHER